MSAASASTPASTPASIAPPSRDWSGRFLAVLSLSIALIGLGYNTWRNETTEAHRNARQAAFLMLDQIAQLQQIVDSRYYAGETSEAGRIAAWGKAGLLRDLGPLVSARTGASARHAFDTWSANAAAIDRHEPAAETAMTSALDTLRTRTIEDLHRLH